MGTCPCTGSKVHSNDTVEMGEGGAAESDGRTGRTGTTSTANNEPRVASSTLPGSVSRSDYNMRHEGVTNPAYIPPEPPALPKPGSGDSSSEEREVLKVVNVDLMVSDNAKFHHTDMYELTQERFENNKKTPVRLVIRRGDPFDVTIEFDREFDVKKDDLKLVFDVGKHPREGRGSRVVILLSDKDHLGEWGAKVIEKKGKSLTVRIFTPHNIAVAKWNFKFDIVLKRNNNEDEKKVFRYVHPDPIYILFNPWCKDDAVFMSDEEWREEYVLNDKGRVYCGTSKQISSRPWNFGQFEDFIIDVCLYLLDKSLLSWRLRGDPVHIVRKISALANAPDDNGVLIGNWSGKYEGGTPPSKWFGSVDILEQYWKTHKGVKFGQCWVFSAVVTTICRCLGIPARSVTNFSSAHDSDGSITIDAYWTPDGKPLEEYNADSVWNFHVWNDVWMTRPDLPQGFGGWQAIDATPQETSDGIYCAGPASVEALKNGLVHLPYDGPFIFAEVNADRVHWIRKDDGGWAHTLENHSIGKNISTASIKARRRMDVTDAYKFPEGSQQERTAVWRAARECSTKKEIYKADAEDMTFELTEKDDALIGENFDVSMTVKNTASAERTVKVTLTATVVNYTGVPQKVIKSQSTSVKVPPLKDGKATMVVTVSDYLAKLVDMCHIKLCCMSQVEETKQFHCQSDDFRLLKPEIKVQVPKKVKVGEEFEVEAFFTNPLLASLTKCEFNVQAALLQRSITFKHGNIASGQQGRVTTKLTPKTAGNKEIIVSFDSRELWAVSGTAEVEVVYPSYCWRNLVHIRSDKLAMETCLNIYSHQSIKDC